MSIGYALKDHGVGKLLHGHVFESEGAGRSWMAQPWNPSAHGLELWQVEIGEPRCRACGRPRAPRVKRWIRPAAYGEGGMPFPDTVEEDGE